MSTEKEVKIQISDSTEIQKDYEVVVDDNYKVIWHLEPLKDVEKENGHLEDKKKYPLLGSVLKYENPTEPVAEEDWEVLQ